MVPIPVIREAHLADAADIMALAQAFSTTYDVPAPAGERALALLNEAIYNGSVFVSETNGRIYGCIVGHACPHPFMDYTVLSCLFVYAINADGANLIRRFIQHGKELGVDAINASTHAQVNSERDRRLMSLLGFKATEVGWHLNL